MGQWLTRGFGQLGEAFDHERQGRFIQRVTEVDQAITRFAGEADAPRNASQPGHERRFERIGQDIDGVVMVRGKLAGEFPARFERQLAVAERAVEDVADFRHAVQDGRHPARGDGVELETGMFGMQPRKQRLRHDRVADPGGGDDESLHWRIEFLGSRIEWSAASRGLLDPGSSILIAISDGPWALRP
jgi:hypothetical protein